VGTHSRLRPLGEGDGVTATGQASLGLLRLRDPMLEGVWAATTAAERVVLRKVLPSRHG
jgi:hypothetical protein